MAAVARGRPSSVWLLCSILQGCSKRFDAGEPLLRVLCKGPQHHLLDRRWDRGDLLKQRRRGNSELLAEYLISLKRRLATEPFIRHDRERVLIARRAGLTLDMLRSHVRRCASEIERLQRRGVVSGHRDAKVTEQHLVIAAQQHILRLDIAVDQFCAMGMLERSEEHTSELQSHLNLVSALLLEKKKHHTSHPPQPPTHQHTNSH